MGRFYFSFIGVFGCMLHTPLPATLFDELSKFDTTKMAHASKSHGEPSSVVYEAKDTSPTPLRLVVNLQELQAAQAKLKQASPSSSPPVAAHASATRTEQGPAPEVRAVYKQSVLSLINQDVMGTLKPPTSRTAPQPEPEPDQSATLAAIALQATTSIHFGLVKDSERLDALEAQAARERGATTPLKLKKGRLEDLDKIMSDPLLVPLLENPELFERPMGFALREKVTALKEAQKYFEPAEIANRTHMSAHLIKLISLYERNVAVLAAKMEIVRARVRRERLRLERITRNPLSEKQDLHACLMSYPRSSLKPSWTREPLSPHGIVVAWQGECLRDAQARLKNDTPASILIKKLLSQGYTWDIDIKTGLSLHPPQPGESAAVAHEEAATSTHEESTTLFYIEHQEVRRFLAELSQDWGFVSVDQKLPQKETHRATSEGPTDSLDMGSMISSMIFLDPSSFYANAQEADAVQESAVASSSTPPEADTPVSQPLLTTNAEAPITQKLTWAQYVTSLISTALWFNRAGTTQTS
ncbi:MAG: hypothetical protein C0514_02705 [Candidatus Puniceispirillum sp.]|nr:hypothetical protein [Candidatus Puniceispirillum sp.]